MLKQKALEIKDEKKIEIKKEINKDNNEIKKEEKQEKEIGKEDNIDNINRFWVEIEILSGGKDKNGEKIPEGTKGQCFGGYLK